MKENWFETWFNSDYYHLLYKNRDKSEAREFLDQLIVQLHMQEGSRIIDICCGKGRHAIYLNSKGFEVDGIDLASKNIACAKAYENRNLNFHVSDMRKTFKNEHYDFALNLFTSFGYFEDPHDDIKSVTSMANCIKSGGIIVLDYLNAALAEQQIKIDEEETLTIKGVRFRLKKALNNGFIEKTIHLTDGNHQHQYMERVKALKLNHFKSYLHEAGLLLLQTYGSYQLEDFDPEHSERLILVAQKP